jgi:hypothetical protein
MIDNKWNIQTDTDDMWCGGGQTDNFSIIQNIRDDDKSFVAHFTIHPREKSN